MKVYIIYKYFTYERGEILEIFNTKDKAIRFVETKCGTVEYKKNTDRYQVISHVDLFIDIEEREVK